MKKSTVVLTCGVTLLTLGMLTACGGGDKKETAKSDVKVAKEGFPIVDKKLELSMFAPASGKGTFDKMPMMNDYAKKTDISFKYTTPPASDLSTKLNLAFASGDLPGVVYASGVTKPMEIQYGGSTLVALEKYIEDGYAPNLKKILDEFPNIRKSITTPDGHIYSLPFLGAKYNTEDTDFAQKANISKGSVWYNGQWLKKLGLSEPKTVDEFYDMLVKFRDNDPNGNGKKDEIPLTTSAADTDKLASLRPWIMNAFGISSQLQQVDDNGKVTVGATQENYRKYLEFMEKLYSEKLLDQEVFSQSDDQKKAKGAENRLGAYTDWFSYFTSGKAPDVSIEDPMAYPLSSEASPKAFMDVSDNITTGAFAVSDKCPSPEAAVRWVDYFYSNEGSKFLNAGPEEKDGGYWHWDTNDKGDKVQVFNKDVDPTKSEELRETITPDYGRVVPKVLAEAAIILKDKNDPIVKDAFSKFIDEQATEKIGPFEKVGWPTLYMSKKQQDELGSSLQADLLTYIQQMEAKFISGKEKLDDASWKEYNDKLNQIGVEKYAKVYQAAYDAWKK